MIPIVNITIFCYSAAIMPIFWKLLGMPDAQREDFAVPFGSVQVRVCSDDICNVGGVITWLRNNFNLFRRYVLKI